MKASHLTVINLVMGVLLLAVPLLVQVTASQGVYDPWCDQDSDGDIDIFDIVPAASAGCTSETNESERKEASAHCVRSLRRR